MGRTTGLQNAIPQRALKLGATTPRHKLESITDRILTSRARLALWPPCRRYWNYLNPMMKITISVSKPAEVETEALVAVVLDESTSASTDKNKKPELKVSPADAAVSSVAADLLAGGELNGKPFESNLLHKPSGLKAKRLLLISAAAREEIYQLRIAAHCWNCGTYAQGARTAQLCILPLPEFPPRKRFGQLWKARSSPTSIPTTTAATARIRRSTRSHSGQRERPRGAGTSGERSAGHRRVAELHP